MKKSRFFLEENAVPSNCVAINTDVRLFDWSVGSFMKQAYIIEIRPSSEAISGSIVRCRHDRSALAVNV